MKYCSSQNKIYFTYWFTNDISQTIFSSDVLKRDHSEIMLDGIITNIIISLEQSF